jgi:tRNA pseudouridine55 synthase
LELAPREIEVHELRIVRYEYPELLLSIACGSGTYVRSLGRDLALAVGSAAVMSALARTAIGPFRVEEAHSPEQLTPENLPQHLLSPLRALEGWQRVELTPSEVALVRNGGLISRPLDDDARQAVPAGSDSRSPRS